MASSAVTASLRALIATVAVAVALSSAHAAGRGEGIGIIVDQVSALVSLPLLIAFALGVLAGEGGRIAWRFGKNAWRFTLGYSGVAARYGTVAAVLVCALYFV